MGLSGGRDHCDGPVDPGRTVGADSCAQPILTSTTLASRFLGERVTPPQWGGLLLAFGGVALGAAHRSLTGQAGWGWVASISSPIGITLGTLYQKRFSGHIDWRTGNIVRHIAADFAASFGALMFETRTIHWHPEFVLAVSWATSGAVGGIGLCCCVLADPYARRHWKLASLFYPSSAVTAAFAYSAVRRAAGSSLPSAAWCCAQSASLWSIARRRSKTRNRRRGSWFTVARLCEIHQILEFLSLSGQSFSRSRDEVLSRLALPAAALLFGLPYAWTVRAAAPIPLAGPRQLSPTGEHSVSPPATRTPRRSHRWRDAGLFDPTLSDRGRACAAAPQSVPVLGRRLGHAVGEDPSGMALRSPTLIDVAF